MEALLDVFGIDWKLLLIQVANFTILLGVLSYFLYRPVMKLLDDRKQMVEKGIKDAEAAGVALAGAEKESSAKIGKAVAEATTIIEGAKKDAASKGSAMVHEAEEKSAAIVREAQAAAEEEKRKKIKEAEQEIAKMVILGIEKTVREK